jgi:cytochrome b
MIRVWDLPTRLFHWLTAALVLAAYVTWRLNWMDAHAGAGEGLLALLLFRIGWGVVGSDTARFARFVRSPRIALRHLARLFHREPDAQIGHNPAGGWMVLLLLALLLGETLTGIVVNNDVADEGPLTELMPAWLANLFTDLHQGLWYALLAAIVLHLAAVAVYAVAKGQDLLRPMLTGHKQLTATAAPPRIVSIARACGVLAASGLAAALIANFL